MNQIEVNIMGQSYLLACPEGDHDRLQEAARRVDEAMCKVRASGKVRSRDRIAVLVALNMAFDLSDLDGEAQICTEASPALCSAKAAALISRIDAVLDAQDGKEGYRFSYTPPPVSSSQSAFVS